MMLLLLLNVLFASTFTLGKAALAYVQPIFFIGVRMVIAGLLLLAYQYGTHKKIGLYKKDFGWFLASILLLIYIPFVFEFWALQYISSAKTCLLYSLTPFITALFAYVAFKEKLTTRKCIGLVVGMVGFLPILMTQNSAAEGMGHAFFLSTAEVVLLVGICAAAAGWLVMKKLMHKKYSPVQINGVSMLGAGVLALITSLLTESHPFTVEVAQYPAGIFGRLQDAVLSYFSASQADILLFLFYLFLLIFIANIVCYNLYGALLRRYSATLLSFSGLTIPFFGALFGWFFLGEHIPWQFFASAVVVCCGLYIFYQEDLKLKKLA